MSGLAASDPDGTCAPGPAKRQSLAALRWLSGRRDGVTFVVLGVLAFGLTVYMCIPGYMGPDSHPQFQQARDFHFTDDHPVIMALIWHYLDRVMPGPLGMLVFINALYWTGLAAFSWVLRGSLGWRVACFVLVGFLPPGFSALPIVYKDGIMHGALLLAIACVIAPGRRALAARLALAVACFLLAIGVRHNSAAAVWPFLALPLMQVPILARLRAWLRLLVASAAGLVLAFALTRGVDRALAPVTHPTEFWQTVPVYDLAGMSVHAGKLLVDQDSPVFGKGMGLKQIQQRFDTHYGGRLYWCALTPRRPCVKVFRYSLDPDELASLSRNWLTAIAEYPGVYLEHRWALTRGMLTVNTSGRRLFWLEAAPHSKFALEYPPSERLLWLLNIIESNIGFVAFAPWVYVALAFLLLPFALLRYLRGGAPLPLALLLSGLAYLLSNLIGASSTTYRYCVWTILCTLLAIFALGAPRFSALRLPRLSKK